MLYELEPAKELTGGPWYGPDAFDSEFITVLQDVRGLVASRAEDGRHQARQQMCTAASVDGFCMRMQVQLCGLPCFMAC